MTEGCLYVKPAAPPEHIEKALWTGWEPSGMQNEVTSASITCHASFSLLFWPAESWVSAEVDRDRNDFFFSNDRTVSQPEAPTEHTFWRGRGPSGMPVPIKKWGQFCKYHMSCKWNRCKKEWGARGIHVRGVCRVSRVSLARPVFSCVCYFRLLRRLLGIE